MWVAHHATLGVDVAVKFPGRPSDHVERMRLVREAQVTFRLDSPHTARVIDQGTTSSGLPFLVMELLGGQTLEERLRTRGALSLPEAVSMVEHVCSVLSLAHARGIIHRDIKPANLMVEESDGRLAVKLIDFGLAKPRDDVGLTQAGAMLGTPAYMSPDQLIEGLPSTERSDLWSLAAMAYEALVGVRPFTGATRGAIGAAMVLGRRAPVSQLDSALPVALDTFFDRALHITPTERFATPADFAKAFAVAARSRARRVAHHTPTYLRIPDRLYGRDLELAQLEQAFERAAAGSVELELVGGYSGIGKTALVEALRKRLAGGQHAFVGGKFDPYDRGTPYKGLMVALRSLLRLTLAQGAAQVREWRSRVLEALGDAAGAVVELLPALADLIGEQPPVGVVSPEESRNQLQTALTRLASALASPERPLVLFLDDLQWADLPSIELLHSLRADPSAQHILLLCTYRDNEVGPGHPLTELMEQLASAGLEPRTLILGPLEEDAILDLLSDVFPGAPRRMRLAAHCVERTRGNAFFLRRLLEGLVAEGVVSYSERDRRWTWNEQALEHSELAEDVVAFVAAQVSQLPARTRSALAAASCIGEEFDVTTLAYALDVDRVEVVELLKPALLSDLVRGSSEPVVDSDAAGPTGRLVFAFVHDRVRESARVVLSDAQAAEVHHRVGVYLLDHLDGAERERRFFELVEHVNRGMTHASDTADRPGVRLLNLQAARRAVRSAAFVAGHSYFQAALELLDDEPWKTAYPQTLALHVEGARAAYLAGDHGVMDHLVDEASKHARERLEQVAALEVRIQAYLSQQRFVEALDLTLEVLATLDVTLPRHPTEADVGEMMAQVMGRIQALTADNIGSLPISEDPLVLASQRIQIGATSAAYMAAPTLLPLLGGNIVLSTLQSGVTRHSPYGFAIVGLVLNAGRAIDASYAVGQMAMTLLDRIGDRTIRPRTLHVLNAHIDLFVRPLAETIEADRVTARVALDTGDLEYAGWALHCRLCNGFYAGESVVKLQAVWKDVHATLLHHQQAAALGCTLQYGQALANLRGEAENPARLVGDIYDEVVALAELREINFRGAVFITCTVGAWLRYVFGDAQGALEAIEGGAAYVDGAVATYHEVWWHQVRALALLHGCQPGDATVDEVLEQVAPSVGLLRVWNGFSEYNHEHRVALVDAEMARILGNTEEARAHYQRAIDRAEERGFAHEHALGLELLARFLLANGGTSAGQSVLRRAVQAWTAWGATAKAALLTRELGDGAST